MSNVLIAYFSRAGQNYVAGDIVDLPQGHTATAAQMIAERTDSELFEIATAKPYSADYRGCVEEARNELATHARPELREMPESLDAYDTVILGYPNWCGDMPMAVYTFLESLDFAGKKILPFCTNGGSGASGTDRKIEAVCPSATVAPVLSLMGHLVTQSGDAIDAWLKENL